MILYADKRFITNSEHRNEDWVGDADWVIPDGSDLAQKIIRLYPNFEFVFNDEGQPVDVAETDPLPLPPTIPTDHDRLEALETAFAEIGALFGGSMMADFYALQLRIGRIGIDDVPIKWREDVRKETEG